MIDTPKANRLHIAFFGKRNVGKSSLINSITNQNISLVSNTAGTTTDPVYKAMELLPIGPVMLIDTAGFDDIGYLGEMRIEKTKEVLDKTDLAILVFSGESKNFDMELNWYNELKDRNITVIGVINKSDLYSLEEDDLIDKFPIPFVKLSAKNKDNILKLKESIIKFSPTDFEAKTIIGDIIPKNALVILVAPQDLAAPKGRLILPQVQVIRDLLDNNAMALTVKETELTNILASLNRKPDLVITDSQVFKYVNSILPKDIPLTSFSILMARYKGNLEMLVHGANAMDLLQPGDKVLIAEACTHHAQKGDIAREKLPLWLKEKYPDIIINNSQGGDFPKNLSSYKLVIHCGSCMFNRKQFMSRLIKCHNSNVPITNFGVAIAKLNGILDKVIAPLIKA